MRLLIEERLSYGYEMAKHGMNLGSVYVLLGRLEDKKCIEGEYKINGHAAPRKCYRPTAHGKDVFRLHKQLRGLRT